MDPALAYHGYLGPAMFVPMSTVTLAAAQPARGEHVLDIACGTGIVTAQLPPLVGGTGRVVGLDISPPMLAVAAAQPRPEGVEIEWKEGNGVAIDLPNASFDLVICQHGLQFFPDRAAGVREMRRVLAPAGRAVVACWQRVDDQPFFRALIEAQARVLGVPAAKVSVPFSLGDGDELRRLFADAGFAHVAIETHVIDARFDRPERFLKMTAFAATAVMPAQFANADLDDLVARITAEVGDELEKYRDGEALRFPIPTNLALAR